MSKHEAAMIALKRITDFNTAFMKQSEAEKSGGGYSRLGPMDYFGTMFPLVEQARIDVAKAEGQP